MNLWELVLEGVLFGLFLSVMVGPIMITIVQASLRHGRRAGLAVGAGIWLSDLLIVGVIYFGLLQMEDSLWGYSLEVLLRYGGGLVFVAVGAGILVKESSTGPPAQPDDNSTSARPGYFLTQGFLINTINPFTFIFWISVIGSRVVSRSLDGRQAAVLLGSILAVIVVTDSLKVFLSDRLRNYLKSGILLWVQRIAGGFLLITGLYILFFWSW